MLKFETSSSQKINYVTSNHLYALFIPSAFTIGVGGEYIFQKSSTSRLPAQPATYGSKQQKERNGDMRMDLDSTE